MTDINLSPLTVVYRGLTPQQALRLSTALHEAGMRSFEVTMTGDRPMETIELLCRELPGDALIGAGTVSTPEQVTASAAAGARFVVSPHLDARVVERTRREGLLSVPGALTPTEIMTARNAGADVVKVFPVNAVGADYLRQLRGPMPDLEVMASGGVTPTLAAEVVAAGAKCVAVGHHLLGADPDGGFDPGELRDRTSEFLRAAGATS
ncbi:bifunctional 4-hydroxy-2-oxoglutarate aldolase/2-dehydro-3-deoxy-phosphogluconate aldolase [Saccharopolyspora aridisoli]|uniref:Bifunctional 4-hydroxy-2-oxoglutarate aldolase/2-dehydro-3-deoxy-phosphogluconate aldolase n=1 Tax=Saccharopolyspora aridisoli TaxID=2530385 RepID=A0A4R4UVA5_9PSEU|nr:bifunctional 4-hydroxy-2-oxoglutarate aldolase/2-dehydro-3-deoxy-phosphogluconate aldolase [Saccharopolyspora aridisoli]TDC93512.1 bifunctional 4-hydroxy-2-oxoglutarate aldolase/2-dehydro-3-deoxy-phosphogluconate aldolase [Saccharopolyspora aridisoli]